MLRFAMTGERRLASSSSPDTPGGYSVQRTGQGDNGTTGSNSPLTLSQYNGDCRSGVWHHPPLRYCIYYATGTSTSTLWLEAWYVITMLPQERFPLTQSNIIQCGPIYTNNPIEQFLIQVIMPSQRVEAHFRSFLEDRVVSHSIGP